MTGVRPRIEAVLARSRIPGCSIAVVDGSGLRWSGGYGFADLRSARPASADTVYHLFSGTKLFTAVAVLQLVETGRLQLDEAVARFVPGAKAIPDVTIRHLLSHQSGLKDRLRAFLAVTFPPDPPPSSTEALSRFPLRAAGPPGERVEYRNVNYALLGDLVTRVSGVEYRDYVRQHILTPLGMDADFQFTEETRSRSATGYMERWDPMRLALRVLLPEVPKRLYGARMKSLVELREYHLDTSAIGGLVGSAPDFGRFLQAQLTGGEGPVVERPSRPPGEGSTERPRQGPSGKRHEASVAPGGMHLTSESIRRMQSLAAEGAAGVESRIGTGLGWKIGRAGDRTFLNHEGGGAGFTSELRLYPESGIGIALMMNMMRMPKTMRAAHEICEALVTGVREGQVRGITGSSEK